MKKAIGLQQEGDLAEGMNGGGSFTELSSRFPPPTLKACGESAFVLICVCRFYKTLHGYATHSDGFSQHFPY